MSRLKYVTIAALVVAGCVTVNKSMLVSPDKYAPVSEDQVRVFFSEDELKEKGYEYERVALLFAQAPAEWTSQSAVVKKLRKEAGKLGANGIILRPILEPSAGAKIANLLFDTPADRKGQAVAIHWWTPENGY